MKKRDERGLEKMKKRDERGHEKDGESKGA